MSACHSLNSAYIHFHSFFAALENELVPACLNNGLCYDLSGKQSDQTYSCPRDWRLSAIWWPNLEPTRNPLEHHSTIVFRGLSRAPLMPREACVSNSRCNFFSQSAVTMLEDAAFRKPNFSQLGFEKCFEKNVLAYLESNIIKRLLT